MISVIIPLYNGARFIEQALDSVFEQRLPPLEVIVIDDGSSDAGADVVSKYSIRHPVVLLSQTNAGQAAARNLGIRNAKGRLIALLDQDDIWYPDHLETLAQPFLQDLTGRLGWTYSNLDQITQDGRLRLRSALSTVDISHPKQRLDVCLSEDMFVLPSSSIFSRAAFDAVGGFDDRLRGYEDDDFFLRLFVAGFQNVYINRALAQWRVFSGSACYLPSMAVSRMVYARKLIEMFPDEPDHLLFYTRDLIAPRFLHLVTKAARETLLAGDELAVTACTHDMSFLRQFVNLSARPPKVREDLLITAVIPLYNGAPFIREAVESILAQTLRADEIIVVDDGSTDDGPLIVAELARLHTIRLIRKENGGQSSARNVGVDHAHGDLIAFLDQDDAWYPNHLAELIKPFYENRAIELGWSYSNLDEVGENGELISRGFLDIMKMSHPKRDLMACLRFDMFVLPSASLISRKAFRSVGGFDERLSGYEDDDLFLRLFQAGYDNVYLSAPLSKWRMHQSSSSYSVRMAVSRMTYMRMLIARFPNNADTARYYVRDLIAPRFFRLMATELRKAILRGTKEQRTSALANLAFVTEHLRFSLKLPIKVVLLPALRIRPIAKVIMEHRTTLVAILRRLR